MEEIRSVSLNDIGEEFLFLLFKRMRVDVFVLTPKSALINATGLTEWSVCFYKLCKVTAYNCLQLRLSCSEGLLILIQQLRLFSTSALVKFLT